MLQRPINHFRSFLLDKLVLRPTRDRVDHGMQYRLQLPSRFGLLDTFGYANYPDPGFGDAHSNASDPPDLLLLKFPGTAGREPGFRPLPGPRK